MPFVFGLMGAKEMNNSIKPGEIAQHSKLFWLSFFVNISNLELILPSFQAKTVFFVLNVLNLKKV